MTIISDMDGVLFDTKPNSVKAMNITIAKKGYDPISEEVYSRHLNPRNWKSMYRNLGIKEEHLDEVISDFYTVFSSLELPSLIPGAKNIVEKAQTFIGKDNFFLLTNATKNDVIKRIEAYDLPINQNQIYTSYQCKSEALENFAQKFWYRNVLFIGDTVSDGIALQKAREKGHKNLHFCAITHKYTLDDPAKVEKFLNGHSYISSISSLERITDAWLRVNEGMI
jgi:phosphoglycolate phosphatase-like HAD superfamily hydrolase